MSEVEKVKRILGETMSPYFEQAFYEDVATGIEKTLEVLRRLHAEGATLGQAITVVEAMHAGLLTLAAGGAA